MVAPSAIKKCDIRLPSFISEKHIPAFAKNVRKQILSCISIREL